MPSIGIMELLMCTMLQSAAERPLVSVYCMTYNHQHTIAQTIESIVTQRTDFPFELIVHEDASTDDTAAIVAQWAQRYPEIIKPIYQTENQFRRHNIIEHFIHPCSSGQYIAICEGDDYWTDPDKLQLQVDLMRAHPEATLCFHSVEQLGPDGSKMLCRPLKQDMQVPADTVVRRGGLFCPTVSLMFRRDVMDVWPDFRMEADVYDYPAQVLAVAMGQVLYMDRCMAVYRFASEGSWTQQHAYTVDYTHIENEVHWLSLFDAYTDGRFAQAIEYHTVHLWFTEYRKTADPAIKALARPCIKRLKWKDRVQFSFWFTLFSVFGVRANVLWNALKKFLLR